MENGWQVEVQKSIAPNQHRNTRESWKIIEIKDLFNRNITTQNYYQKF